MIYRTATILIRENSSTSRLIARHLDEKERDYKTKMTYNTHANSQYTNITCIPKRAGETVQGNHWLKILGNLPCRVVQYVGLMQFL
jgi:hypothetical protein